MEGNIYDIFGLSLYKFLGLVAILMVIFYVFGYCSSIAKMYHEEKAIKEKTETGIYRIK